jgi:hypothetical protein
MRHDELNRWLAEDEEIVPSSGFATSVMDAVRIDAADRRALPFPWRRMLPGLAALAVAMLAALSSVIVWGANAASEFAARPALQWAPLLARPDVGWIVAALAATAVLPFVSLRLFRLL